jgi:hypothetical protein
MTTSRCKSTVILRVLAGTWASCICEPFTQAYYAAHGETDVSSKAWPLTYDEGKAMLRETVALADAAGTRVVVKDLAYQALPALLDADFLRWVQDTFHVVRTKMMMIIIIIIIIIITILIISPLEVKHKGDARHR